MNTQTTVVIFALLAAFGLLAIVTVDIFLTMQEAEAVGGQGCRPGFTGFNASQEKCFHPDN